MKYKNLLIVSYFFFQLINVEKSFINCKTTYKHECEEEINNLKNDFCYSYPPSNILFYNNMNFQNKIRLDIEEITRIIKPGEVQKEFIFKEKLYIFNINSFNYNKENDLLIHFYPLNCHIDIVRQNDENEISIEKIRYSEHYAFYAQVERNKLNSTYFKIKALINSINDYGKNRTFHLIINSFKYINNTNLTLKEKEPTFINFYNTIDKINLLYNLANKDIYIYPISVSFFIKEKIKFKIIVSNNEGKSIKKIISYKDRILIETNFIPKNDSFINIYVEKIENNAKAVMIVNIIGDYLTPIFFQKNILNIGIIPTNASYQYFYMEVFKGEEGEILLTNKRYKGILISKLIPKEEINEFYIFNSSDYYPKEEEINNSKLYNYLEYNEYRQNMNFNSSKTNTLRKNGCYLLITYYSIYLNNKTKNTKIIGSEFTLLCGMLEDENEDRSQVITIPFNEFIYGTFESSSFNIHYYSLFIPENTTNLIMDMNFFNIKIYYYGIGVKRFNIYKAYYLDTLLSNIYYLISIQKFLE